MTGLALVLVLTSAVAHASWNFLIKQVADQEVYLWWTQVAIAALLLPVALLLVLLYPVVYPGWWFILGTSILHAFYFGLLGRSYHHADLSVAYPIARGMGPALVPILAALVLGEKVAPLAIGGIATVVLGIYTVYWWGRVSQLLRNPLGLLKESGTRYALLTGLVIAMYSVWDKVGVRYVHPIAYMYLMSSGSALLMAPYILKARGTSLMRSEMPPLGRRLIGTSALMFLGYGLILTAYQFARISYISPSREVGIVIGVLLGIVVLKEPFGRGRVLGSSLVVLGVVIIALAP